MPTGVLRLNQFLYQQIPLQALSYNATFVFTVKKYYKILCQQLSVYYASIFRYMAFEEQVKFAIGYKKHRSLFVIPKEKKSHWALLKAANDMKWFCFDVI